MIIRLIRIFIFAAIWFVIFKSSIINGVILFAACIAIVGLEVMLFNQKEEEKLNQFFNGCKNAYDHPELSHLIKNKKTMTDRYNALTVALDRDIRDDDAESIINAIKQLKGVVDVTGNVVDTDYYVAKTRITSEVAQKLVDFAKELYGAKK
jgi:hypothetical protein